MSANRSGKSPAWGRYPWSSRSLLRSNCRRSANRQDMAQPCEQPAWRFLSSARSNRLMHATRSDMHQSSERCHLANRPGANSGCPRVAGLPDNHQRHQDVPIGLSGSPQDAGEASCPSVPCLLSESAPKDVSRSGTSVQQRTCDRTSAPVALPRASCCESRSRARLSRPCVDCPA